MTNHPSPYGRQERITNGPRSGDGRRRGKGPGVVQPAGWAGRFGGYLVALALVAVLLPVAVPAGSALPVASGTAELAIETTATGALASATEASPNEAAVSGTPQRGGAAAGGSQAPPPSIEERTAGMERMEGFFDLYWDDGSGRVYMEIDKLDTELIWVSGLAAGLGSNDIGLDRGQLGGTRIVTFQRVGPKVLMVEPNYRYRALSDNPDEVRAVEEAFAKSTHWGFTVAAESGDRVLVEMTDFVLRDTHNITPRLTPGSYRFDSSRSAFYRPNTVSFPENTELEASVTFVRGDGGGGRGGGRGFGGAFEGVGSVAADADAVTLRTHHSFVQLPDDGYEPREYDPRAGYGGVTWADYATPLGEPMEKRYIRRHRLEKVNPGAAVSDPVEPIVYYVDRGTPEPIRSALIEGASWWNQAFEAAGYRNAFQVRVMPEGAHNLDTRYNVIQWVHRSTRGWSYGGSVTDPRTGEIIKGHVTLGSLRVRQDYLIAEGLLSPYEQGDEEAPELAQWALARIRQLSAHEVGHTIGLGHNYYDSSQGRISVLDYPHPWVTLNPDGTLDHSEVYEAEIGEWDRVSVTYGYQDFPDGTDEHEALQVILQEAWEQDLRYMTNQDTGLNPKVDQWSNGTDPAAELQRMMDVRRASLDRFGANAIKLGRPMATIEEVLVPLYLHHRYQIDAAGSALGGVHYIYAIRGDGRDPFDYVPADEQWAAFDALMRALEPPELALPASVIESIPPRPSGFGRHRELFPRYTGSMFDVVTPATVVADHVVSNVLTDDRAARMVEQHALDSSLPGLGQVIDRLVTATFGVTPESAYEAEINRVVERVVIDRLMALAAGAGMPQVRAIATDRLVRLKQKLAETDDVTGTRPFPSNGEGEEAHFRLLAHDIERFLSRPAQPYASPTAPSAPPGAPIGEPAMDWLGAGLVYVPGVWTGPGGTSTTASWGGPAAWLNALEPPCSQWYDDIR